MACARLRVRIRRRCRFCGSPSYGTRCLRAQSWHHEWSQYPNRLILCWEWFKCCDFVHQSDIKGNLVPFDNLGRVGNR